tara:strand:+ start:231 stop:464 length:234 start_codon:yes stop_codon:yes gene_type:complete
MKFEEITDDAQVFPGEYLLYVPKKVIVVCGAYKGDTIRVLENGRLIEDKVENFKKIRLTKKESKEKRPSRCKGCGQK